MYLIVIKMDKNGVWVALNLPQISPSKCKGFAHDKTLALGIAKVLPV